ncbi:zinc finger, CCHC-type containing protein [Tanacetum coccineum]|uniref:Zinc finger, CCHC-type containing protein n=1 Tax=Tanacetum coccineum TaxID=301880 RepID=A0ABQ4WV21_9ASTR
MADAAMKHMASNFSKLDKFEGVDFRRWQKKIHFLLSSMSVVYVVTTSIPKDDFKHTLKHNKEELTLVEFDSHLRIEESLKALDSDKPKGNNVDGPSVVNMVEHNNSFRYNDNKDKHKHQDTKADPNKKSKVTCWKCEKPRHLKMDCKGGKLGNKPDGSSTNDEALDRFKVFKIEVELQQGSLIKRFRSDGGVVPEEVVTQQPKPDLRKGKKGMISQDVAFGKEAINDETNSILGNNTWVLADLPLSCKPLGCKWIFKIKLKVDGTIERFEAILVIQGFRQKSGINYFDTYAPVACISTIRMLIAMASIHNLIIHHMDVMTTFLNDELDKEQAPKQWHQKFDEVVLSSGYLLNQAKKFVYSKFDESGKGVIICLYVDDMLIFKTDQVQVDLTKEFSHYIEKELNKFNYFDCTPVSTPMDISEKMIPNNGQAVSQLEYSRVIGCLMYAMTCTRHDIAFAVGKLSRYTSNPSTQHWQVIQRVLKYLKKTMDYSLVYIGYLLVLEGYTDASWISNTKDNSSTSGWVFLLGGGAISWASKKQTCITSSTTESEFVALAAAGKEVEWLRNLILEILLWSKPIAPISIRCDSAATMAKTYSQMSM